MQTTNAPAAETYTFEQLNPTLIGYVPAYAWVVMKGVAIALATDKAILLERAENPGRQVWVPRSQVSGPAKTVRNYRVRQIAEVRVRPWMYSKLIKEL